MAKKKDETQPVERDQYGHRLKAEAPDGPGHYMGKFCGFDYRDGKYIIAGSHSDVIEGILDRQTALDRIIEAHNKFVHEAQTAIDKDRRKWWARVRDDYGLPENVRYHRGYFENRGAIEIVIKEEPAKES